MGSVDSIVSVTITKRTTYPSRKGFGIPCLVAYHTFWTAPLRRFSDDSELVDAGVPASHPLVRQAQMLLSQGNKPKYFLVGKRTIFTQIVKMTPKNNTEGFVYEFEIERPGGTVVPIEYTVTTGQTLAQVATAIAALIDPVTEITSAAVTGVITNTTTAGMIVNYRKLPAIDDLEIEDTTLDPGIAADLSAIETAASKNKQVFSFYGIAIDQLGRATIEAAAAWTGARKLLFMARTSDSECADPLVTDDVMSTLKASSVERAPLIFAQRATNDFRDAAALGRQLPKEPGSSTWAFKPLTGIEVDTLSSEEEATIQAKNGNTYTETGGVNMLYEGKTPTSGVFIDTVINLDFSHARIQETVFGFLAGQEIVTFDQSGIDMVLGQVQSALDRQTRAPNKIYTTDVPPAVDPLLVEDTEESDRLTRRLRGVTWRAKGAGAIHGVDVSGTVTF